MSKNRSVTIIDQSGMIVRTVKVNRTRSNQEALNATGRTLYKDDSVVKNAPQGKGQEVEAVLFKLGHEVSCTDFKKEFELRGLDPVDLQSISALNESDPSFADEHPNATQWKDKNGKFYYAAFSRFSHNRSANVYQRDRYWGGDWWFVGVRKINTQSSSSLNS